VRAAGGNGRTSLARITVADAEIAECAAESSLRALSVPPPEVELCHVVDGGLATLVALGTRWRAGVPYVVTEHDAYLRAELVERAGPGGGTRVLLRFLRALNRLGYAEAAAIIAPSERMRRWALHHDADRRRLRVVPPGVDRRTIRGWTTRRTTPWWPGSGRPRSCPAPAGVRDAARDGCPRPG